MVKNDWSNTMMAQDTAQNIGGISILQIDGLVVSI